MSRSIYGPPLVTAQRAFEVLVCPPAPLAFDGRGFAGLPQRMLPLDELRRSLMRDESTREIHDPVWQELEVRGAGTDRHGLWPRPVWQCRA
jgi:hypothetical protein